MTLINPTPAAAAHQRGGTTLRRVHRGLKRRAIELVAAAWPYRPQLVEPDELDRVVDYANGGRRLALVMDRPDSTEAAWLQHREIVERELDAVLHEAGIASTARELRLHAGKGGQLRLQCWAIPGPHGPALLTILSERLVVLDLADEPGVTITSD